MWLQLQNWRSASGPSWPAGCSSLHSQAHARTRGEHLRAHLVIIQQLAIVCCNYYEGMKVIVTLVNKSAIVQSFSSFIYVFRRRALCESSLCAHVAILLTQKNYCKYHPILTIFDSKWAMKYTFMRVRFSAPFVTIRRIASKYAENRSSGWKAVVAFNLWILISKWV